MKKFFITAFLLIAAHGFCAEAAVVDLFLGEVDYSTDGSSWEAINVGMSLEEGMSIRTGDDSVCELILPAQGIVRLEENTEISVSSIVDGVGTTVNMKKGGLFANFINLFNDETGTQETFEVETTSAVVAVRGTEFGVTVDEETNFTLAVQEGSVDATPVLGVEEVSGDITNDNLDEQAEELDSFVNELESNLTTSVAAGEKLELDTKDQEKIRKKSYDFFKDAVEDLYTQLEKIQKERDSGNWGNRFSEQFLEDFVDELESAAEEFEAWGERMDAWTERMDEKLEKVEGQVSKIMEKARGVLSDKDIAWLTEKFAGIGDSDVSERLASFNESRNQSESSE